MTLAALAASYPIGLSPSTCMGLRPFSLPRQMEGFQTDDDADHASRRDAPGTIRCDAPENITITESSHRQIEAWAEENGAYFSVAIETLALIGLGVEDAALLPRLVGNTVERVFQRQFHRLAKLLAVTAIAAAESNLKVDALLLQLIRREAAADPDRFVQNMTVSSDPAERLDARIRQMRDDMKAMIHAQAIAQLKPSLEDVLLLLDWAESMPGGAEVDGDG